MKTLGKERQKSSMKFLIVVLFVLFSFFSCSPAVDKNKVEFMAGISYPVKHAKGFEITEHSGYYRLQVTKSYKGNNERFDYFLTNDSSFLPHEISGEVIITPIKTLAALSATYIPFIRMLNQLNSIVAISGKNTIYDSTIYQAALSEEVKDLGQPELNMEQAILLNPDVIMGFAIDAQSMSRLAELKRFKQRVVINAEYMEATPLAKAEWIKVFGLLYDNLPLADSIFKQIENNYISLTKLAAKTDSKPTVLTAAPWKGTWYVPGGNSFQAGLLKDAGAHYLWADNEESVSLPLDFEVVLSKALEADFWLNVSTFRSRVEMEAADERYALFSAYKNKQVYNNTKTMTSYFGNDYWETGAARPDLILSDLIQIFHPELLSADSLTFYERLP